MKSDSSTFRDLPSDGKIYRKLKHLEDQCAMNNGLATTAIGLMGTIVAASGSFIAAIAPWQENVSWVLSLAVGMTTICVLIVRKPKQ